ncbi:S49 family peptidase [Patescibacteria group bacterium]|nr:S49 family peptidase [Patescibacteria group bacterium]MBU1951853.1 S49 family peptidase [Patescibacteria group bacterium]MBU2229084.1 S49 family peptidase [Patescibacteria group bacterium]
MKKRDATLVIASVVLIVIIGLAFWVLNDTEISEDVCTGPIAGIELHGELVTYTSSENYTDTELIADQASSEDIVWSINVADNDPDVEAIIIEVDSLGGYAVPAEEIANALKSAEKPTVALIRGYGISAAYWAATGADWIIASENSEVGGIGITMSYLDYSKQNKNEGITYQQISSGKFKDAGDPDKPLTEEEKAYLQRDTDIMNDNFVNEVAEKRDLDIVKVRALADGSSMLGQMALENGLIDELGGMPEVEKYLESEYDIVPDVCWY